MKKLLIAGAFVAGIAPAWAAVRTVTLAVPGMTCAGCPLTVREALSRIKGVRQIRVDYAKRALTVTFDDTKATVADLTRATANAGYPSRVEGRTLKRRS
ncbi:MAG: mercury resistance system periplasmic binding protein MerP [Steroidobacteraceae bacterium]